jgi:hypothetical protein
MMHLDAFTVLKAYEAKTPIDNAITSLRRKGLDHHGVARALKEAFLKILESEPLTNKIKLLASGLAWRSDNPEH